MIGSTNRRQRRKLQTAADAQEEHGELSLQ